MVIAASSSSSPGTDLLSLTARLESSGPTWARVLFPNHFSSPFGHHHIAMWDWAWAIPPKVRPRPFVACWGRGQAKTTTAQGVVLSLGARRLRPYALYVSRTQDQADEKVADMATMLEESLIGSLYPGLGDRKVGKYGHSRGWRRNRIRTASGFTVDALGLDTAARGRKIDSDRPSILVLDDLDNTEDTLNAREKLIRQVTRNILPTLTRDAAVIAVQNMIGPDGFFGRMLPNAENPADYLADRVLSGPLPALYNPEYSEVPSPTGGLMWTVTDGTPTWPGGQDLAACQSFIATFGLTAFRAEAQHEPISLTGGVYDHLTFRRIPRDEFQAKVDSKQIIIDRVAVWCDPAVSNKDVSDCQAVQADGLARDGTIYRLESWEKQASPVTAMQQALRMAQRWGGQYVGIETDQGGDTWDSVFREAQQAAEIFTVRMHSAKAGSIGSKLERAGPMITAYDLGRIVHVEGSHLILESALTRFPKYKPLDLHDAAVWSARDLILSGGAQLSEPTGRIPRVRTSR